MKRKISSAQRERLRAMREKYGLGEYKSSIARAQRIARGYVRADNRRLRRRVRTMARRKSRRSSGGGWMSYVKPIVAGAAIGALGKYTSNPKLGLLGGAGAGYFVKKGVVGAALGAAGAYGAEMLMGGAPSISLGNNTL